MTPRPDPLAPVRARLDAALAAGVLPPDARAEAQALVARMDVPVRVVLMGPPRGGRSAVLNLLAGARVVPDGLRLPTLRLVAGSRRMARLTQADGRVETLSDPDPETLAARGAVFVEMTADLPALGRISLLEVVAGPDPEAQARAAAWAARRADIAIWCSRTFDAGEARVWRGLPAALRGHGILLRTHADDLGGPEARAAAIRALGEAAGADFPHVLAIDTPEALAARDTDGPGGIDRARLRASGGQTLIATVLRQLDDGRQALADRADVLLCRHGLEAIAPVSAPSPAATRRAFEEAVERLARAGRDMTQGAATPTEVMRRSVAELVWLDGHLDAVPGTDPLLAAARDAATRAADMAQLMQVENRDSAAVEAVSLMIQLRHTLTRDLRMVA
ncbi:hypothetical protein [Jannaschia rubra]|uniref:Uncharacterized protein n=1 Tax=Jannaschia rubra TaxID=282197 RepID=A0A0M6XPS5_9RHOB|nr:hypothetical protein [Jannaschia rubra]CTQ33160.1 hypothetical protein JAN5088_01940 [Jannaschia rubra]SFG79796.1 hypothetical protein SAMN04488517_11622 [Jannaschia rubra]